MSNDVKLSSRLAKDDDCNGLDFWADRLAKDPHQVLVAFTWITVDKLTTDVETGAVVPTVVVKRIEPIDVIDLVPTEVVKMALELNEARTGKRPLPFEVVETIDGGYVHPDGHDA